MISIESFIFVLFIVYSIGYTRYISADNVNLDDKKQEILLAHNQYRQMHGVPVLELDPEMNEGAQNWADALALMDDSLMHRPQVKYGENLWMAEEAGVADLMRSDLNPVRDWYIERDNYRGVYDNATNKLFAHFTQIIWKDTTHLGVGIAQSLRENLFVVCHYNPKGNEIKGFVENVRPLLEEYADLNVTDPFNVFPVRSGIESIKCECILFAITSIIISLCK